MIAEKLAKYVVDTVKEVCPQYRSQLGLAIQHMLQLLIRGYDEFVLHSAIGPGPSLLTFDSFTKPLRLTQGLLSADGRMNQQGRFNAFHTSDTKEKLSWTLLCARSAGPPSCESTMGARRARATRLAPERGGNTVAAMAPVSQSASRGMKSLGTTKKQASL